jgi:hypothetical protein
MCSLLKSIIAKKVLITFGVEDDSYKGKIIKTGIKVFTIIGNIAKPYFKDKVDALPNYIQSLKAFFSLIYKYHINFSPITVVLNFIIIQIF